MEGGLILHQIKALNLLSKFPARYYGCVVICCVVKEKFGSAFCRCLLLFDRSCILLLLLLLGTSVVFHLQFPSVAEPFFLRKQAINVAP